jgi:NodT family efflux transporter outer membrane factor (OMF) lipoprotein
MAARGLVYLLALSLAACAVGPNFKRPPAPQASGYGTASSTSDTAAAPGTAGAAQHFNVDQDIPSDWWTLFQSPAIDHLVQQALAGNPDLAAAQAALRQAHELYIAQRASWLPVVQGNFDATRAKNPLATIANPTSLPQTNPYYSLYTAQLSLSYMPDVFGAARRTLEAARAQAEVSRFQLEATYVTLSTNVVVAAIQEAALRGQITAIERLIEVQGHATDIVRGQRQLGTASELDLLSQQAAEAQTVAMLPPLQKQLGQSRDALSALLGRLPSAEPPETFRLQDLALPQQLPMSVPSKLVEQRPDVRQAEENMHVASAQAGIALADMLPQFSITADTGSSALQLDKLFSPYTGFWNVGASLTQTLFDAGALLHRHRAADAALDEAGAQYRAAVILACQNVADTLRALQADADALAASAAAEQAAGRSFELAGQQLQLGTISVLGLLTAEQSYQQSELALVQVQANRLADTAGLFQALGGGWWNRAAGALQ